MNTKFLSITLLPLFLTALSANAQMPGWRHSGRIYILTTPEGANLPASASEDNFPLLVRLHQDFFDFSQAGAHGEDLRFTSAAGNALAFEIEDWKPADGTASIWVRIHHIKGNARQAITMYWGNSSAPAAGNGERVFGTDAGFCGVWHLGDDCKDSTPNHLNGTSKDTSHVAGIIGNAEEFRFGSYIGSEEEQSCLPKDNEERSMSMWMSPTSYEGNPTMGGWGKQGSKHLSYLTLGDGVTRFHGHSADPRGKSRIPLGEWHHVAVSLSGGEIRFYLDGVQECRRNMVSLETTSPSGWNIGKHTPGPGNWAQHYRGALDEVRFEAVARSADWVKLCYENQKPLQTLAGTLVQDGNEFSVSPSALTIQEGKSASLSGKAGGACKVYWVLKDGGKEQLLAVDRFNCTFDAGRLAADKNVTVQFKAVYADVVKTKDIAITIREYVPNPVYTLATPATWNGRDVLEIAPVISNLAAMRATGAGDMHYAWKVSGMATIHETGPGKLILKRAQNSGELLVTLALDNGDVASSKTIAIKVREPERDAWVQRIPAKDEKPANNQFYPRDDDNVGTLYYNGTLDGAADSVFLKLYAGDKLMGKIEQQLPADRTYALATKLNAGLVKYRTEFGTNNGNREKVLDTAENLVCGDAYIIQGQSNAEAWADQVVHPFQSEWLRSFGTPITDPVTARTAIWGNAISFKGGENRHKLQIGYWGVELGKQLIEQHQVPVFIINGAQGGTRIDQHQRNDADPTDVNTIYGRLLWRLQQAKLTHGIRAVLWHQGENDQGAGGPSGTFGWEEYQDYFVSLAAAWKEDYPNIKHYYVYQIWPGACGTEPDANDRLRDAQRTLPYQFSNMSVMSTLGIRPGSGCHYSPEGYAVMACLMYPLLNQYNYGVVPKQSITPPNIREVCYTSGKQDEIALRFDQSVKFDVAALGRFYLDGEAGKVASGNGSGNLITLQLAAPSGARNITYVKGGVWKQEQAIIRGTNDIAALTFCEVPILPAPTASR
ncbi:MAG: DUF2341 domain-containing protein [Verrucomicrobia bacterium]|nr:DUF2341 domain-containing protein [Verrucomicrobiota bacterium]